MPSTSPASAYSQIRTFRKGNNQENPVRDQELPASGRDGKRKLLRIQKNATSGAVRSRFIRPKRKYYRSASASQQVVTLPPTTLTLPHYSTSESPITTAEPEGVTLSPEFFTSTSTSTSVSMSYTTVLDSARITTVLNSDHFLLTNRKENKKASLPPSVKSSDSSKRRLSRTSLPLDLSNKFHSSDRKVTKDI